ncbi:Cytochrome P450 704C1 [Ananas comosus]|uniref:Cytochrome P450 704C1 n=1 Tax=Ananas comosus TaxID=4615 RepID=A0A199VBJ2_ANACO|nr:Cytochrome P450 704C1 [Ananas comosus]
MDDNNNNNNNNSDHCLISCRLATATATAALGLLVAVLIWGVLRSRRRGGATKRRYPPAVGTVFHQLYHVRRLHDYHTRLSRRHRTFRLLAPARNQIYTSDPAGSYNYINSKELFGDGIFAVDGDKWRQQRKLASFEFSTKVLRDFSGVIFKKNAAKLAHIISQKAETNQSMEIQDLFMKSTMDSIFSIGFGLELDCLNGSNYEGSNFAKAFDDSSEFILLRYVNPFWKMMRFFNLGSEATLKGRIKVVDDFVYKLIHMRVDEILNTTKDSEKKADILSRFVQESRKGSEALDYRYLRDIILNFVIAGKDTTAGSLSWFFYMICKHPEIQEKIYEEVKGATTKTKDDATVEEFLTSIDDEALNKMHYLHATLSETLRLYPSVPLDNKVCFSDDVLPNGYNATSCSTTLCDGRMEYLWGKDAEIFRPERWLDESGVFQPESPFKFTAFQAGPRICLGKDFAYRQMKIFAAVLLRFFLFNSPMRSGCELQTMITFTLSRGSISVPLRDNLHFNNCDKN